MGSPLFADVLTVDSARANSLEQFYTGLFDRQPNVRTAGIGVIKADRLVWSGYYGESSPGVPASSQTLFNIASITKTVTAETVLRLVEAGQITLNEPMSPFWIDPDLLMDPRHQHLTPRIALTHTTGFSNWRSHESDNRLRLNHDPGTAYGYSGEGYEYLARFVEKKLGRRFPDIVRSLVFRPIGMSTASFGGPEDLRNMTTPVASDGSFSKKYRSQCTPIYDRCLDKEEYSAADDMVVTVQDYAAFLISVMASDGYGPTIAKDRSRVQSEKDRPVVHCQSLPPEQCPTAQGYGLGWEVLDYAGSKIVGHGGSDWSDLSIAYFYEGTQDGLIVFLNGRTLHALEVMPDAIEAIDPASPMAGQYRGWLRFERKRLETELSESSY